MDALHKDPESFAFCTERDKNELSRMRRAADRYGEQVLRVEKLLQGLDQARPRGSLRSELSSWLEQYLQFSIDHSYLMLLIAYWNLERQRSLQKAMPVERLRHVINNLLTLGGEGLTSEEATLLRPALSYCLTWSDAYDIADGIRGKLIDHLLPRYPTEGVLPEESEEILKRTHEFLPTLNTLINEMSMKRVRENMDKRKGKAQLN